MNVYAHSSEQMKRDAARTIDRTIGATLGADTSEINAPCAAGNGNAEEPADGAYQPKATVFEPYKGKKRKPGNSFTPTAGKEDTRLQLTENASHETFTPPQKKSAR